MRFLLILILVCTSSFQNRSVYGYWVVERNSTLAIDGSSNINRFTCDVLEYLRSDTLKHVSDDNGKKFIFNNSHLSIDIKRFDCHQKFITADFRKMLKSDQYPELKIHFVTLDGFQNECTVSGVVVIELAGVKKKMDVTYHCKPMGPNQLKLEGQKLMKFSDFALEPPKKIGGLIRINEEINVHFNLYFRKII